MRSTIPMVAFLLAVCAARAQGGDLIRYASHPASLIAEIAKRGAAPVVADLNERASWVQVIDTIAEGDRDWLMVGLALLQGADGGSSDDLSLAVSRALIPNPAAVLELFAGQVDASRICRAVAEFGGHRTLESALRELQSKITSIESVQAPGKARINDFKAECLASLREGEPRLHQIYGAKQP